jgi:hypothetical protein
MEDLNQVDYDSFDEEVEELAERLGKTLQERESIGVAKVAIDHSQFKTFKNIIHFATDPEGLGLQTLWEYTRQYQYIRDFYSLMCPNCNEPGPNPQMPYDCWGKTAQQLTDDVLFENDVCPKCHLKKSDAAIPQYNTVLGCVGMRGGKSVMAAIILLYELHHMLMIDNPQKTWNLAPGQEIYLTCCTTKIEQAKDTIFAAVDGVYENSPWFTKYNAALKNYAIALQVPFDKVFVKNLTEIRYLHKQIFVDNTGANSAGIAGKTRYVAVIDEIARFMQTDSRLGVDMVYDTLSASLLTLSKYGSKMICISSPIVKGDKIMNLIEAAKEKRPPNVLWFHHSTWDFNPNLPFEDPYIQNKFNENPVAAKRDFGADPPGAQNPWMEDEWKIDECVDVSIPVLINTQDYTSSLIVKGTRSDMVSKRIMWKDIKTTKHIVVACDPGYRKDSFGLVIAYLKAIRTVRGIEEHMFVGAAEAWVPTQKPRKEVDFGNVLTVIHELAGWWLVDKVVYDQWSSPPQIQDLMMAGIDAEKIPLKKEDWDNLYGLIWNKQIHLLHPKIGGFGAKLLLWELKNLEIKDNGKVDHSIHSSSDIAVCLARAAKTLMGADQTARRVVEARAEKIGQTVRFRRP